MNKIGIKVFKYKGQKFMLAENEFDFIPGFRIRKDGLVFISISKELPLAKRNLELHRLIKNRGLRNIKVCDVKLAV